MASGSSTSRHSSSSSHHKHSSHSHHRRTRSKSPHTSRSHKSHDRNDKHKESYRSKRERSPETRSKNEDKKLKVVEEEKEEQFKRVVEAQLQRIEEQPKEEELLEKARLRRMAILQKYKQEPIAPQSPNTQMEEKKKEFLEPKETLEHKSPESEQVSPVISPIASPKHVEDSPALCDIVSLASNSSTSNPDNMFDMFSSSPNLTSFTRGNNSTQEVLSGVSGTEIQTDSEGYIMIRAGEMLQDRYLVGTSCGSGVFSKVLRAKDTLENNKEVVIKVIRDNDFMKRIGSKEVEHLQRITDIDPDGKYCCVRLLSYFKDRDLFCLVFEPMLCNLREFIHKFCGGNGLSIKAVQVFSRKILLGLYLLKRVELVHADLKPDNILVMENKKGVKIGDMGSAIPFSEAQILRTPSLCSGWYRPPEIVLGISAGYDVDMWSLGCTIYEMVTGTGLFTSGSTNNDLLRLQMELLGEIPRRLIKKGVFKAEYFDDQFNFLGHKVDPITGSIYIAPIKITHPTRDLKAELLDQVDSDEEKKQMTLLHDLLQKMLTFDPAKRIKAEDALNHPFFQAQLL